MTLEFEWDENKNATNVHDHGVSFEEAKAVFFDPMCMDMFEPQPNELASEVPPLTKSTVGSKSEEGHLGL